MNAPYRVVLSEATTTSLKSLTQKTGLSANILSRFAMLISFEMPDAVVPDAGKPGLTINRATLFGDLEAFLMSAYAIAGGRPTDPSVGKDLAAHISRGVAFLNLRSSNLTDFLNVIYASQ
jgi:DNA sulfur modification protein DndE